jgi:hypothetical protein
MMYDAMPTSGPIHPHQKKRQAKYRWCTCSQWQFTLVPVVSSKQYGILKRSYVPVEKYNRYIYTYITTYLPSGAHVFNAAWKTLHRIARSR